MRGWESYVERQRPEENEPEPGQGDKERANRTKVGVVRCVHRAPQLNLPRPKKGRIDLVLMCVVVVVVFVVC